MSDAIAAQPAIEEPRTYFIDEDRLDHVRGKFARLARRAKKLGVEAADFVQVGKHTEYQYLLRDYASEQIYESWSPNKNETGRGRRTGAVRVMLHVQLTGAQVVKLAGWSFVATLDHELGADNTIVRVAPNADGMLPADYRHRGNQCDHCQRAQQRNNTFVVKHDDGRIQQVGSTCIKDFLGHDATDALSYAEMCMLAAGFLEDEGELGFGGGEPKVYDVVEYLAWVAKTIREHGWVSRAKADDLHRHATADTAYETMREYNRQQRHGR